VRIQVALPCGGSVRVGEAWRLYVRGCRDPCGVGYTGCININTSARVARAKGGIPSAIAGLMPGLVLLAEEGRLEALAAHRLIINRLDPLLRRRWQNDGVLGGLEVVAHRLCDVRTRLVAVG
jgi:hypothetical protein